jgi:hypothetical protein
VENNVAKNACRLVEEVLIGMSAFFGDDAPIPYIWKPSTDPRAMVVVLGENASGKSFFRKCVSGICSEDKTEIIPLSMAGRRNISYNPVLALVYGDESYSATGMNSIRTVVTGVNTCRERDTPHVIVWDEPDIGASDATAAAMGRHLADFAKDQPALTIAAIVATHRKFLVRELADCSPHYLYLGDSKGPQSLQEWLMLIPPPVTLEEVTNRATLRFAAIQQVMNDAKSKKAKQS